MDFRKVDLNKLCKFDMQKNEKGGILCHPQYQHDDGTLAPLVIQTPVVRIPFGLSRFTDTSPWTLSGVFENYKSDPLMKEFHAFASNLDDFCVQLFIHHSEEWLGKKKSEEVIRELFNPFVNVGKDAAKAAKYDPTFKATARTLKDGGFWASAWDVNGDKMSLNDIPKACRGSMKIKLSSCYYITGKIGFAWDLEWVRITASGGGRDLDFDANMYGEPIALPAPSAVSQEDADAAFMNEFKKREAEAMEPAGAEEQPAPVEEKAPPKPQKRAKATGN